MYLTTINLCLKFNPCALLRVPGRAQKAKQCGAVILLAQLLHWLQQNPSEEVNCASLSDIHKSVWRCVLEALYIITTTLRQSILTAAAQLASRTKGAAAKAEKELFCWEQLEEAPGELTATTKKVHHEVFSQKSPSPQPHAGVQHTTF